MQRLLIVLFSLLILLGCSNKSQQWYDLNLKDLGGNPIALSSYQGFRVVFIFLSPECPLCSNYSTRINELQSDFENDSTLFLGVVGGTYYSKNEISRFLIKHKIKMPLLLDNELLLARALNASITPEVFLINSKGNVVYQGAIDNWAIDLGKKRLAASEHYLLNALNSLNQNKQINPFKTDAVGCFIE